MIRQARKEDVHAVVPLIALAIDDLIYPMTGQTTKDEALATLERYYVEEGNRFSYNLVAVDEQEGQIAGMILCYYGKDTKQLYSSNEQEISKRLGKPVSFDLEADDDEYYIDAIAVHPDFQGKGIASALMHYSEQKAVSDGVYKIGLNVDFENPNAEQVYKKKGYVADKKVLLDHSPYWHMVKQLSSSSTHQ